MNINEIYIYLQDCLFVIAAAGLVLGLIVLVAIMIVNRKLNSLKARYLRLTGGVDSKSMEEVINSLHQKLSLLQEDNKRLLAQVLELSEKSKQAFRGVGLVRFNAFLETGGEMSFAVALINEELNGVLITGIYGREDSTTYAKQISAGKCGYRLMNEEQQAIETAIRNLNESKGKELKG